MRRRRRSGAPAASLRWPLALAVAALVAGASAAPTPPSPAPAPTLADCAATLDDAFPSAPGSATRSAVRAAAGELSAALPTVGVTPFTTFVSRDGLMAGNGSSDVERQLIANFKRGLPPDKQASWLLYGLLPDAASAADLARARVARTRLSNVTRGDYDLRFESGPAATLYVRDRLGQRLRVLASRQVCNGWVHTVDGILWPGATTAPSSVPDPAPGGVAPAPAPSASNRITPIAFAAAAPPGAAPAPPNGANPNAIASTAWAATGAAITAAVDTIQKLSNNGTGGPPPPALPFTPADAALANAPAGPDPGDRSSVVVGAVLGAAAGVLAAAAAATAALIYRRRRRLGGAHGESPSDDGDSVGASSSDEYAAHSGGAKAFIARVFRGAPKDLDAVVVAPPSPPDGAPLAAWSPGFPPHSDAPCWEMAPSDVEICVDAAGNKVQLGCGGFGAVYRGRYQGVTDVAVKLVTGHSPKEVARFANEVAILKALRHTNVVQFLGASLEEDPATGGRIMLVTEYLPRGDLWRALSKDAGHVFSWYRRGRAVALDVVRGLAFMHSKKVMHLDLKSANILLGRDGTAKVADVGLAKILTRDATHVSAEGTFDWAAPEVLSGSHVSEKADIYSLGVVLWEVVTGERPHMRQLRAIRVPDECPAAVAAVIADCRSVDPAARPTAKDVYDRLASAPTAPPAGARRGGGELVAVTGGAVGVAAASPFEAAAGVPLSPGGATTGGGGASGAVSVGGGGPGTPSGGGRRQADNSAPSRPASGE